MDLGLTDEQSALVGSFAQLLAKESSPERVRAAEPGGFDERLWRTLVDTGALTMGVPEHRGGWGASLLDLTLVAEQIGRSAAPAPAIEAQVAARVLAGVDAAVAGEALAAAIAGERLVTLALHAAIGGVARLVPAGAVCDTVIVRDDRGLVLVPVADADRRPVRNLASAPLADVRVDSRGTVLASGEEATARFEAALDEWMALTAAAIVGAGTVALEIACAYAVERRAFGSPIGAFQAVAHPLADDATHLDGARLLARKAAWALEGGDDGRGDRGRELAAMAFAFAGRTAERATYDALHVHGGYGFMLEHDVQLHYRRARGWPRVWGDAEAADHRAADARYRTTTEG